MDNGKCKLTSMRLLFLHIILWTSLYSGDWDAHMQAYCEKEWAAIPDSNRAVIWKARGWGAKHGFSSMGAIYANEDRGRMGNVRPEVNGDESAGPGQNLVRYAAIRTFGRDYTSDEYVQTRRRLQTDLNYSLEQSWEHIKLGLGKFDSDYEVWKYYNGQNAPTDSYPARVQAWDKFLDRQITREKE